MSNNFHITDSVNYPNTYFIFRENGSEIKVKITGNMAISDKISTLEEKAYFETYVLKNKTEFKLKQSVND